MELIKIEDIEIEYNACKQLACSVIMLALDDAISYEMTEFNYDKSNFRKIKSESILFCSCMNGEYRRSREFWCSIAGINPYYLVKSYNKWKDDVIGYRNYNGKYKKLQSNKAA